MSFKIIAIGGCLAAIVSFVLMAANKHNEHNEHKGVESHSMENHTSVDSAQALPLEGGQSTFSAIIELVAMLERDANTNWDLVSIDQLHSHLLDMDLLMRETTGDTSIGDNNTISFIVHGNADSIESVQRMVPTHAQYVQQARNWRIENEILPTGVKLTISVDSADDITFLKALGFYGFMSLDSHHQAHHFQMARGQSH